MSLVNENGWKISNEELDRPIIAEYEKAQRDLKKRCLEVYSSGEDEKYNARRSNTFDGKKRVMEKKAAGKDMVL